MDSRSKTLTSLKTTNGQNTTDEMEILKSLVSSFFSSDLPSSNPDLLHIRQKAADLIDKQQSSPPPLTEQEFKLAVYAMKPNKAPAKDGICTEHIQFYLPEIGKRLKIIMQACLDQQYFPNTWKEAKVLILPKPGKSNYEDPSSYRPVSLLPVIGKILEKIILSRLESISDEENWLSGNQHGFRKGKSTVTVLEVLITHIRRAFIKKANTKCVLLDIKGAFDNAWPPSIICKLKEKHCPSYLINLIASFLHHRTASLKMFDSQYEAQIQKGCPQGSILSPFLWNLIIDGALRETLPKGIKIQAYADDLVIFKTGTNEKNSNAASNQHVMPW